MPRIPKLKHKFELKVTNIFINSNMLQFLLININRNDEIVQQARKRLFSSELMSDEMNKKLFDITVYMSVHLKN